MKPKIDIYRDGYYYGLAWFDEDGEGLRFGECSEVEDAAAAPKERDLAEHWHAYRAALTVGDCSKIARGTLQWESQSRVVAARAAARAAVKLATAKVPWPEWAKQALAAGWKPPKGWKP